MARTKEKPVLAVEALRPYVKRAMEDPELREDLVAAFVILLTGVTLGVLYNPWTGAATREWFMTRVAGENGGFEDYAEALGEDAGNGDAPTTEI